MKKFFSVLISILFAVCLLCTLLLSIVRNNFSFSSISHMATEMLKPVSAAPVEDGLFHPGQVKYSLAAYEDYGDFDINSLDLDSIDFSSMDVNEIVQSYLDASGVEVEPEFIAEVLATPELSEFVDKYAGEVIDYMTGESQELNIDSEDIVNVMNKSFDMYEEHTGEKIDRSGLAEAVEASVADAKVQIEANLDIVKEENAENLEYLKKLDFFLSLKFFLICAGICVLLALIIFLINRNLFAWLKYVFMPCFIDGLLLFIIACIANGILPGIIQTMLAEYSLPGGIYEGIWSLVAKILGQMKLYGIIAAIAGIALWTTGFTLGKKVSAKSEK